MTRISLDMKPDAENPANSWPNRIRALVPGAFLA